VNIINRLIVLLASSMLLFTIVSYGYSKDLIYDSAKDTKARIANPASVNCINSGGTLIIRKSKDNSEYGVCVFEDNKECEEWALFRGECPVGGIDLKNFRTDDPFKYCAAIGTIDVPDGRYTGKKTPDAIVDSLVNQGIVSNDAPNQFKHNFVWRCMNYKVWACMYGANIPCPDKANTSKEPTSAMVEYCKENPSKEIIPAYIAGKTTIFQWSCSKGKPSIAKKIHHIDQEGFIKEYWYEIGKKQ